MKNAPTKKLHPDFIEEVKQADIVDVISGYIDLKKRGREYLGLCPFHDERTPSFSVSPTKGLAYCFGCSWGGNAIKFLMELGKVSFTDAVMELARLSGVRIRYEDGTEEDLRDPLPRPALSRNSAAAEQALPEEPQKDYTVSEGKVTESVFRLLHHKGDAEKARTWLESRGITREIIKRRRLGLEKRVVAPDESKPERKETYWAIAIFIPVPNRPGRFFVKKRVAPWLSGSDRPSYLGKWAQFGVPATIWFAHNPDDAQETWFCEGEWDALALGELARQRGKKVAVACSTAGCGTVPKDEELVRLPGQVTIFFDRNDAPNKNGLRPGDEGAKKLALALGDRGRIASVPMPDNCNVKGWDVCNALDAGYTWEDFEAAASDASGYTASIQTPKHHCSGDRTISRDEWELTFGFGKRLRNRIKQALSGFKGFGKHPQVPAPRLHKTPDESFQAGQRLQTWQDAVVTKGYRYILDRSDPGLGKSHAAGIALPDAFGAEKLWYISADHRNPTTGVIESNYVDLPVRHNGLKVDETRKTPNGNPFRVWPKLGEEPDTQGNCFRVDLFQKFRAKNLNVEAAETSPICATCKLAHLCKSGSGGKYGATFRGDRKNALAHPKIRAHADSMPDPAEFDYFTSGLIWDEVGTQLKPMDSITVTLSDFDQTWAELETKAPDLHEALKPLRLALRPLLAGETKQPYHGWDDAGIRALLPQKPDNLAEIISELEATLKPDLTFLHEQADSITANEARAHLVSKSAQNLAKREFRRLAHEEFSSGFQRLALNWLVPFLNVWDGERGALRCERQQLTIFRHSDRHTAVARAAKFNIFLDATITRERLALLLGINPDEIYVVEQETPSHGNLRIIQITGMGKLGKERSLSMQQRVALLRKTLSEQYPGIRFGDWKAQAQDGDGQWFVNLRGSNEFQTDKAMSVFGVPYQNVGYLQALYQTLPDEYAPLDKETPHEGLQRFIESLTEAEIEQSLGRLRSRIRPNEELTFIFVGDYDLSFLSLPVEQIEAFQICPEAGTEAQITRWKILEAVRLLKTQEKKITQQAIASSAGISQPLIAKVASQFGGWKHLSKILLALLDGFNSVSNNFPALTDDEKWIAQAYLPGLLDEPPEVAVQEISQVVRVLGIRAFLRILTAATLQTQARLLALVMQASPGFLTMPPPG